MSHKSRFTLKAKTVFLVFLTVIIFVLSAGGIASYNVEQNQKRIIKEEINSVAQIIASNSGVKSALNKKTKPFINNPVQKYANQIMHATHVDFIVVLDQNYIRYSHPAENHIGKQFSSPKDAQKSSKGKIHYSHRKGILGTGYRIFKPIFYHDKQVGIVCVGLTDESINKAILSAQKSVFIGSLFALIIGIIFALFLARHVKKSLFDMEPEEIATKLTELYAIIDSIDEALIAINNKNIVVTANYLAKTTFPSIKVGKKLDKTLSQLIFDNEENQSKTNEPVLINAKEFIVSTNQLIYEKKNYGQIALLQDQSRYQKLSEQLAGSEQYIQALRAQSHEFLNKLQAIYGMIELKQYDNVTKFIGQVNQNYQQEFGQLNQQIESPALVGFLTGKINQAKEQMVNLTVTKDSHLPKKIATDQLNLDLIKILGNLIDNALAAIKNEGKITIALNYDGESSTLIIEVTDNGSGISPQIKRNLFKRRYSTKGKNHGYGLILVNQIINDHHGFLEISSCEPHGSSFYIELPISERKKQQC